MKLVQLLLPMTPQSSKSSFEGILQELTEMFGGATAFLNSPADGLWKDSGQEERDRIVTVEVMVENLDRGWWSEYRQRLERDFEQQEIVVRALEITRI